MTELNNPKGDQYVPMSERIKNHKPTSLTDMFNEIESDLKEEVDNIVQKHKKNEDE